jgi:hypothetical protein
MIGKPGFVAIIAGETAGILIFKKIQFQEFWHCLSIRCGNNIPARQWPDGQVGIGAIIILKS